ncbi:MAG: PLP-dependent aminotransferase family protein [Actinobacteria bacterium]|nr:PLP-dependent aminotransferase family protein [Actinomycetota bacterium]
MLSLAGGLPDPALLPAVRIARGGAASVGRLAQSLTSIRAPTEGLAELRRDRCERGVEPERVVVTTGSRQGLDLLARVGVRPGEVVAVEQPGYLGAIQAFRSNGARLLPIAGDRDGMRTDVLAEHLAAGIRPRLVSVVTDLSNPSGSTLSDARRDHLASLAERYGFLIVEDDPYGRLRWRGPTLARLRCRTEFAASLGTVSKVIAPGCASGGSSLRWRGATSWWSRSSRSTCIPPRSISASPPTCWPMSPSLDRHLSAVRACYRARSRRSSLRRDRCWATDWSRRPRWRHVRVGARARRGRRHAGARRGTRSGDGVRAGVGVPLRRCTRPADPPVLHHRRRARHVGGDAAPRSGGGSRCGVGDGRGGRVLR